MSPVRTSIVIPTKNNIPYLSLCLESLIPTLNESDEIIIVSNGTDDDGEITKGYINGIRRVKIKPLMRVIHIKENGFSPACNAGLSLSQGEYIFLMNDDTIVAQNWLETMFAAEQDAKKKAPEIKWGYFGPWSNNALPLQTLKAENGFPHSGQPGGADETASRIAQITMQNEFIPAAQLSGFCLGMTRECLQDTGLLDSFGLGGFEDNDWCIRAQEQGYLGFVAGRSFVFHFGHQTLNRVSPGHKGGVELVEPFMKKWCKPREKKLCISYRVRIDTEEDLHYFQMSLEAVKKFADFIVVLNDHSTFLSWTTDPGITRIEHVLEEDHGEVRDRNRLLHMARETGADWIWNLDHDEVPDGVTKEYVQQIMNPINPSTKLYVCNLYTLWRDDKTVRADGVWHHSSLKCFHDASATYGDIHGELGSDLHCPRAPSHIPQDSFQRCFGITVKHYGYVSMERCRSKQKYYQEIDTVKDIRLIGTPNYEHLTDESNIALYQYKAHSIGYLMLARNELMDVVLRIRQYRDTFSDFVIVDTGSTDGTAQAAKYLGARVERWRCCDKAEELDHVLCDFSAARNYAISKMDTEYIFFNDPDEELTGPAMFDLDKTLLENADGIFVEIDNLNYGPNNEIITYKTFQPRLFKNNPELIYYSDKIHETLESAFTKNKFDLISSNIKILHYGFLKTNKEERRRKNNKYAEHLVEILKDDPDNARALYALAVHLNDSRKYDQGDPMLGRALMSNPDFWAARWELALRFCHRSLDLLADAFTNGKYPRDARLEPAQKLAKDLIKWFPEVRPKIQHIIG